jgi:hypothetical protein
MHFDSEYYLNRQILRLQLTIQMVKLLSKVYQEEIDWKPSWLDKYPVIFLSMN